jgi:serine/threonine protein phosphatase 1
MKQAVFSLLPRGDKRRDDDLPTSTEAGERLYVVGDVHGEFDHLRRLLLRIDEDHASRPPVANTRLIFLGDLIDRGPASAAVISLLMEGQRASNQLKVLMGNHEAALLESMDGNAAAQRMWLDHGGDATLQSYGISLPAEGETAEGFAHRLRQRIPGEVASWISELPLSARSGSYFFCHAGIRPGIPLHKQKAKDLLWIRDEFLLSDADHGAIVVHGHSICGTAVEILHNRINVDTGAYQSGILSALALQGQERWVISTHQCAAVPQRD